MRSAAATLLVAMAAVAAADPVTVHDSAGFCEACAVAGPGTVMRLASGRYAPGVSIAGRHGGPDRPIVTEAAVHGVDPRVEAPDRGAFTPLALEATGYGAAALQPTNGP